MPDSSSVVPFVASNSPWFAIIVALTLLFLFFTVFFIQDHLNSPAFTNVPNPPQIAMIKVKIPLKVILQEATFQETGVKVQMSSLMENDVEISCRIYSGVSIDVFHHVLQGPWPWFNAAFFRGNLFGSEGSLEMGPLIDLNIQSQPQTVEFKRNENSGDLDLGNERPRTKYPYVLVSLIHHSDEIGALIQVIHVKDQICQYESGILSTHIKHVDGRSMNLGQIYLSTDDEDQAMCSVCQVNKVTRVIFPV